MSMKMTMAEFVGLEPCPFCGGEAEAVHEIDGFWTVECTKCGALVDGISAWNSRAPIEYEGWFYLPKPKEGIVDYGEPEMTKTENGYKVRHIVDVVDEAARKWGDDLGEYIMRRICEIWNSRAERTCHKVIPDEMEGYVFCSECGAEIGEYGYPNYCQNCGCKVVKR